ncbi:protein phosphatase 1 regulatory subunit 3C [Chironomus tepperi]|uniref:protein phosphatase 1 regulatory subunit 3C n=1 Tax=Chironomus tepperi TaxID=113505 RepID=UPI00391F54DB
MPAYYEMLVSQSPPLFSHSPPTGFLSEYGPNRFYESPRFCRSAAVLSPLSQRRFPPQNQQQSLYQTHLQSLSPYKPCLTPKPRRSCLTVRKTDINNHHKHEPTSDSSDSDDYERPQRAKKRVVFADDKGLELEQIKIMSESSTQPPTWSLQFLAHVTQGMISPVPQEQWTIDFRQPASDYLEFRRKLESNNVSLENVIVKESESTVVGTVKVKNLSFHKEVIIRSSWDSWKSYTDTTCTYSKIVGASGAYVIYDTFSFKVTLPPHSRNLEFCVCYRSDGKEFWDSNGGTNYKLTNRVSARQEENELVIRLNNTSVSNNTEKKEETQKTDRSSSPTEPVDVPKVHFGSWSEFSKRHSESPLPYW